MDRSVEAKFASPDQPLLDALIIGGFVFPATRQKGQTDKMIKDSDGVTLFQRKNQLCRRVRKRRLQTSNESKDCNMPQAGDMSLLEMLC
mmetsp:Transcript_31279/g.93717  ORF Transcript_31279/g.93717 Transcript_31279/m.93717 type:complete len:89 (-) Transcript_31279:201-467(-)